MSLLHAFCPGKRPFVPKNKDKFVGEYAPLRSGYEKKFAEWLDKTPAIIKWAYESVVVSYYDPVKRKRRRYYPDFTLAVQNANGTVSAYLVEIKPLKETQQPKKTPGLQPVVYRRQLLTYFNNVAKWKAAESWCAQNNFEFKIINENHLNL
jgi:hypothetical protein